MRIKFLPNEVGADSTWNNRFGRSSEEVVLRNETYVVYGITLAGDAIEYRILFGTDSYTQSFDSHFFEVIDNRLSRYFCFGRRVLSASEQIVSISFREWVEAGSEYFYYHLVEGREREVEIFGRYKALMELEFRDPGIKQSASIIMGANLECPNCENIWEEMYTDFEMCKCNRCGTVLLNPLVDASSID